jgi:hypothetical protein
MWKNNVIIICNGIFVKEVYFIYLAQNREVWRAFVNTVMNRLVR